MKPLLTLLYQVMEHDKNVDMIHSTVLSLSFKTMLENVLIIEFFLRNAMPALSGKVKKEQLNTKNFFLTMNAPLIM